MQPKPRTLLDPKNFRCRRNSDRSEALSVEGRGARVGFQVSGFSCQIQCFG